MKWKDPNRSLPNKFLVLGTVEILMPCVGIETGVEVGLEENQDLGWRRIKFEFLLWHSTWERNRQKFSGMAGKY